MQYDFFIYFFIILCLQYASHFLPNYCRWSLMSLLFSSKNSSIVNYLICTVLKFVFLPLYRLQKNKDIQLSTNLTKARFKPQPLRQPMARYNTTAHRQKSSLISSLFLLLTNTIFIVCRMKYELCSEYRNQESDSLINFNIK